MIIATWNVNSVRARIENVLQWLDSASPDIVFLQEIKVQTADFPRAEFEARGLHVYPFGQKSYNGVAILSKKSLQITAENLTTFPDDQARYLEAVTEDGLCIGCAYVPNGNPVDSEKLPYKRAWLTAFSENLKRLKTIHKHVVIGGDFNIIPEPKDCYDPLAWAGDALFLPEVRQAWQGVLNLGYYDAFRACSDNEGQYTFWDYQAGRWPRDEGIRIDHFLLSPAAADRMDNCWIDRAPRGLEKASDHTPVLLKLK